MKGKEVTKIFRSKYNKANVKHNHFPISRKGTISLYLIKPQVLTTLVIFKTFGKQH